MLTFRAYLFVAQTTEKQKPAVRASAKRPVLPYFKIGRIKTKKSIEGNPKREKSKHRIIQRAKNSILSLE
jgi:hypothetical protein